MVVPCSTREKSASCRRSPVSRHARKERLRDDYPSMGKNPPLLNNISLVLPSHQEVWRVSYSPARSVAQTVEGPAHKASPAPPPSEMARSTPSSSAADSFVLMPESQVASVRVGVTAVQLAARLPRCWSWPAKDAHWGFGKTLGPGDRYLFVE